MSLFANLSSTVTRSSCKPMFLSCCTSDLSLLSQSVFRTKAFRPLVKFCSRLSVMRCYAHTCYYRPELELHEAFLCPVNPNVSVSGLIISMTCFYSAVFVYTINMYMCISSNITMLIVHVHHVTCH